MQMHVSYRCIWASALYYCKVTEEIGEIPMQNNSATTQLKWVKTASQHEKISRRHFPTTKTRQNVIEGVQSLC